MSATEPETAGTQLRYVIDSELCSGHGRCYTLAPEDFSSDDVGYGEVIDHALPMSDRAKMEDIVAACPEAAISIEEVPAS